MIKGVSRVRVVHVVGLVRGANGGLVVRPMATSAVSNRQAAIIDPSTRTLAKSITLKHRNYQSSNISTIEDNNETKEDNGMRSRPLVILLTWLAAQDKHVDKYSNLYLKKGFDVLTVKTSPWELLFPSVGARKIAQNCVTALQTELTQYPSVVIHAFSVGASQFGELRLAMRERQKRHIHEDSSDTDGQHTDIEQRIKGVVFDSVVPIEEISNGVSRSMSANPFLIKLIKGMINSHMIICDKIATKHYRASSAAVWNNYMRVPALVLVSQNDLIGTASANQRLTKVWRDLGIDVTFKCWEKSGHVQHLPKHPVEYEDLIDRFLDKLNMKTNVLNI